jgi:hypothetical protein
LLADEKKLTFPVEEQFKGMTFAVLYCTTCKREVGTYVSDTRTDVEVKGLSRAQRRKKNRLKNKKIREDG